MISMHVVEWLGVLSNCLFWAISKRLTGGKLRWSKSKTWIGFHVSWIDEHQSEWEYTLTQAKKQPWWYIPILYRGVVKRVVRT